MKTRSVNKAGALVGSGSAVAVARLSSLVFAAAQLPLLTRLLSPSEYSSVALAIAIAAYFSLLSAESIILGFQRFPGSNEERSNYSYAITRMITAVVIAGLLVVGAGYLLGRVEISAAFAGWGVGLAVNRVVSTGWLMWGRPWQYAWNLIGGTGARTAVLLILILAGWNPLLSLGIAGLASAAAALVLSPRIRVSKITWKSRPWPFSFGINLALASLAYTVLTNGNLLLLTAFVASDRVGKYAAMSQVAALSSGAVLGLVLTVAYPRLRLAWDKGHRAKVHAELVTLQLGCLFVASATIALLYVANHFLLKLIVREQFVDGGVLALLIMATAFAAMGQIESWNLQFQLEAGKVARGTGAAALIGILITLGLASVFREQGAAIGATIGFLAYLVILSSKANASLLIICAVVAALAISSSGSVMPSSDVVAYPALAVAAITLVFAVRSFRAKRL